MCSKEVWNGVSSQKCEQYHDLTTGFYPIQQYKTECLGKSAEQLATCHRQLVSRDGYGWVSLNGCVVDKDSNLRNGTQRMTRGRGRHELDHRNKDACFKARGPLKVDDETMLKIANFNSGVKTHCGLQKDMTEFRINYLPPENNPQCVKHIIPPKVQEGGWVRGGMDTRNDLRRLINNRCTGSKLTFF
jgi:hypothetical protein